MTATMTWRDGSRIKFIEPLLGDMMREHEFRRPHLPELSWRDRLWLQFAGLASKGSVKRQAPIADYVPS